MSEKLAAVRYYQLTSMGSEILDALETFLKHVGIACIAYKKIRGIDGVETFDEISAAAKQEYENSIRNIAAKYNQPKSRVPVLAAILLNPSLAIHFGYIKNTYEYMRTF